MNIDNGWYVLIACLVCVIFVVVVVFWLFAEVRDGILFRPIRTGIVEPTESYRDEMIEVVEGSRVDRVHTRWFERGYSNVLLFLHGNSGCLSNRHYVVELTRLARCDLVLVDYRGYGQSSGDASLDNMRRDALCVFDRVAQKYTQEKIIVMSESIGSVSASYLVSLRSPRILVMLCGLSSFRTIYREYQKKTKVLEIASQLALRNIDRVPNSTMLSRTLCPVLYIHSREDRLVPYCCAEENHQETPSQFQRGIITIEGGHASPSFTREQLREVLEGVGLDPNRADEMDEWRRMMMSVEKAPDFYIVDI